MCSAPVTFGGGLTIVKGVASGRCGRNSPRLSHVWANFASIAAGLNVFSIGIKRRALPDGGGGGKWGTACLGYSKFHLDRKNVVEGKSVSLRWVLGGRRIRKKKQVAIVV